MKTTGLSLLAGHPFFESIRISRIMLLFVNVEGSQKTLVCTECSLILMVKKYEQENVIR